MDSEAALFISELPVLSELRLSHPHRQRLNLFELFGDYLWELLVQVLVNVLMDFASIVIIAISLWR